MAIFYNYATLSFNGNDTNSNIVSGEICETIRASKNAVSSCYTRGTDITYVITLINSGAAAMTNVTVTDDLGAYEIYGTQYVPLDYNIGSVQLYVNGELQPPPAATVEPPLVFSGITVPANSSAVIVYTARANNFAPLGADDTIVNTAVITGGCIAEPITVTDTIGTCDEAHLCISKSLSPAFVCDDRTVTYTFVIQNSGNTAVTELDDTILRDTFNPILSDISVTFNGDPWAANVNYTYSEATGQFATLPGQITVPAADYIRDPVDNTITIQPGVSIITVTGTLGA